MDLHRRFIRDVAFPLIKRRAGDGAMFRYLREFERTQYLPAEEIRTLQARRLCVLLDHAYRRCAFYRERFEAAGLRPGDVRDVADLARLPILEKRDVQEHRDRMVAEGWPAADLILDQTGGSTGTPVSYYMDRNRHRSRAAATLRHNRMAGWDVGDRCASLWGAVRDRPSRRWRARLRARLIKRQITLDTSHLTEAKLAAFAAALGRFRPEVIHAYARSLALLARFCADRGLRPCRPRTIVTSAEVLEPADRALIREVFDAPVFDRYGCREFSVVASECGAHEGLHVMAEGLLVEVVRGDRPAAPGEVGAVVVTDLLNLGMPMIRYRIGDMAAWAEGPCPCGRGLPRLRDIAGRVTDFLVGPDGRLVSGVYLATYVVAQRPGLGQVQIHQEAAGAIRYKIRPGAGFRAPEDLDHLRDASRAILGAATAVDWEFVDTLPPEPSGKFLFSRSSVSPAFLGPEASWARG